MSSIPKICKDFPIRSVLVVDDEDSLRLLLIKALQRAGFSYMEADCAEQALEILESNHFDLMVSDIVMPGMDGLALLRRVKNQSPQMDVIIMTGHGSEYSYVDIMNAGASDYVTKPFNIDSIFARISRIARERKNLINLQKTNQELCRSIERANVLAREAKEASKAKTFFLASMSHEIRTPLNGIVGYTDMLMDTRLDEEQRSFLNHARFSCEALLSVVNDILDFSKVEAGRLVLENIGFDPEVLCFDTIDVVRTRVNESEVELRVLVGDGVPGFVKGDPHRYRQVLLNLLSNAAKFTAKGSITLAIDSEETIPGHCRLIASVKDTGIGISKNQADFIFKPFVQSEDDITNRYGGTGLGLAISKNIARKMDGDIWVESTENKGSEFYFSACFEIGKSKTTDRVRPAQLKNKIVLLCAENKTRTDILLHEITLCGLDLKHATLGDLEKNLKAGSIEQPDIAVIDFGNRDKASILRQLQKYQALWKMDCNFSFIGCCIPAPGIADAFKEAGIRGFLPKPVSRRKLSEMIAYVIGLKSVQPDRQQAESKIVTAHLINENSKISASILLVEDNPVNQKMTKLMLSKAGYRIDVVSDGREAVDTYTSSPDVYDMVFMDINMPRMDGFEATRNIRLFEQKHPDAGHVPILALTANVLDDFKHKCKDAGMDDFLTKPIKRDIVFKSIQKWVRTRWQSVSSAD